MVSATLPDAWLHGRQRREGQAGTGCACLGWARGCDSVPWHVCMQQQGGVANKAQKWHHCTASRGQGAKGTQATRIVQLG